tara:strand:- start:635 stop:856 length:222 start_codon:yes stop_codon:yes gene_type:complete
MNEPHESQIKFRAAELKPKIAQDGSVFGIRYSTYSPRAFFICATEDKAKIIKKKLNNYLSSPCGIGWDTYFEI